jgi:hypothetical protein
VIRLERVRIIPSGIDERYGDAFAPSEGRICRRTGIFINETHQLKGIQYALSWGFCVAEQTSRLCVSERADDSDNYPANGSANQDRGGALG